MGPLDIPDRGECHRQSRSTYGLPKGRSRTASTPVDANRHSTLDGPKPVSPAFGRDPESADEDGRMGGNTGTLVPHRVGCCRPVRHPPGSAPHTLIVRLTRVLQGGSVVIVDRLARDSRRWKPRRCAYPMERIDA
jgi:hypothetical protein